MKACFRVVDGARLTAELAANLPCRIVLDFDGAVVEVAATTPQLIDRLCRVYRYFLVDPMTLANPVAARMVMIEAASDEAQAFARRRGRRDADSMFAGHLLLADWLAWGMLIESGSLLHYYASKLLRLWVVGRWDAQVATFHAASLSGPEGGGILLIGEAAAGKTSLTLRLIDHGFRYCADDTSCIRRSDLTCIPFPMAFVLRADRETGQPRIVELHGRPPDIALLDEPRWLFECWDSVGAPFRPTHLYWLGASNGAASRGTEVISIAQTALLLLKNMVMPLGADAEAYLATEDNFDLSCRLAEVTESREIDTSDLDVAFENILCDFRDRGSKPRRCSG
jgi:hypothetical protein